MCVVNSKFDFLNGYSPEAAKLLIGCRLCRSIGNETFVFRIIETEAYHQSEQGSHCFRGITKRNHIMFKEHGLLYVYFIYGMYHCANIVTGKPDEGSAVLLRAVEQIDQAMRFEPFEPERRVVNYSCSGPGKLCRQLNINKDHNGMNLLSPDNGEIFLLPKPDTERVRITCSKRTGLSRGKELEWRFFEKDNPLVSRPH